MSLKTGISPISCGNVNGLGAVVFSIPFILAGIWVISLTGFNPFEYVKEFEQATWWNTKPPKSAIPRWSLACIGLICALGGITVFIRSFSDYHVEKRREKLKKRSPHLPWQWDYHWNNGQNYSRLKAAWWNHLVGILIILGFHAVAWSIAYEEKFKGMIIIFPIGISLFTLLISLIFYVTIRRDLAHDRVQIKVEPFPIKLNTTFNVNISGLNNHLIKKIEATLSAVVESYHYEDRPRNVNCDVIWEWKDKEIIVHNTSLSFEITLPSEIKLSSKLSERPAQFWELHLYAACDGPDLDKRFLLPIYE